MSKYLLPFLFSAAAFALHPAAASRTAPPPVNHGTFFAGYFQQDADSDAEADSDSEGNYDVFYDRLAPDGHWLNDDDYGYVWQPNVAISTTSWRPYSDGHWVWTDRGWFWDSNENFGWATYHYGRWVSVEGTGWVWVPGRRWAPAWVSWRHTDNNDYVGWAPLPPEATFNTGVGVQPWCDSYYDIGPIAFAFIRIADFGRPSYREYCLPPQQNLGFFNQTTNITNITYNNNVINNYGPQYQTVSQLVQQHGGQQIPNYKINYAAQTQANAAFKTSAQGNQLNVLAPPPTLKPTANVKPQVTKELGKTQVDRGWRDVPPAQAQQLRQKFAQQTPVPKNLPPKPVLPAKPQIQAVTKGEQHPANEPAKGPQAPGGQPKPFVEKPEERKAGAEAVPKETPKSNEVRKAEVQQPANEPAKGPQAPGGQLKPFVEKPEERKAGPEAVPKETPKSTEVRKAEVQQPAQKLETKQAPETVKPAVREEPPKRKVEETRKEPAAPPQPEAGRQNEQPQPHPQPQVGEANAAQPRTVPPREAQESRPKPNPAPQAHKPVPKNEEKKKEEDQKPQN
jgi:hypothetical protein